MKRNAWLWLVVCVGMTGAVHGMRLAEAGGKVNIAKAGDYLELSHDSEGRLVVDRLPLYRSGKVRYFSAGIGIEERAVQYPPFSLKVVFTAGGKPFLADVAVTIQSAKGAPVLTIPREQVQGPWLFIDLPAGVYDVTATQGAKLQRLKGIKVEPGKQKVAYLRWLEDPGTLADRQREGDVVKVEQ